MSINTCSTNCNSVFYRLGSSFVSGIQSVSSKTMQTAKKLTFDPIVNCMEGIYLTIKNKEWEYSVPLVVFYHADEKIRDSFVHTGIEKIGVQEPTIEEFIFREVIQDIALKHIPMQLAQWGIIGKGALLNKNQRIHFTSFLYALSQLKNIGKIPAHYVGVQVIGSFFAGLAYGEIKESDLGLAGAIGAHMANNVIVLTAIRALDQGLKYFSFLSAPNYKWT